MTKAISGIGPLCNLEAAMNSTEMGSELIRAEHVHYRGITDSNKHIKKQVLIH